MATPMSRAAAARIAPASDRSSKDVQKESITLAAAKLFNQIGYQACTLREIADAVGLSKAGLYYYYPSKEAILRAIADSAVQTLVSHLGSVLEMDIPLERQLREVIIGRVEAIAEEQDFLTTFWQERAATPEAVADELVSLMRDYLEKLVSLLERARAEGVIKKECDVEMAAWGIIGITGWCYHWYKPGGRLNPRQIGEHLYDLLWDGLRHRDG